MSGAAESSADAPGSPDCGESETAASAGGNPGPGERDVDGDVRFLNMNREVTLRTLPQILQGFRRTKNVTDVLSKLQRETSNSLH